MARNGTKAVNVSMAMEQWPITVCQNADLEHTVLSRPLILQNFQCLVRVAWGDNAVRNLKHDRKASHSCTDARVRLVFKTIANT